MPISPLIQTYEELINLTVIYKNENNFRTDYIIESSVNIKDENSSNFLQKNKEISNSIFSLNNIKKYRNNLEKIIKKKDKKIKKDFQMLNEEAKIEWKYNYENLFKCRIDNKNEINVYYISSFMPKNFSLFYETIINCVELFDSNVNPITLISDFNGGGLGIMGLILLEAISPLTTAKFYIAFRTLDNFLKIAEVYSQFINNEKTCETINEKELLENWKKIDYGNGISDYISQPFNFYNKNFRKTSENIKSKLINKRKPTDIIIIADGYSYSTTSLFLKLLQYYGEGITVGYFGHPNKKNIPFDSSLSPSPIIDNATFYYLSEEYIKLWDKYQFTMQMALMQSFYTPNNMSIPLEYVITPVDEFQPFYELYSDETYEKFIKIVKDIHKKYKTNCNPKNKKLVKVSSECDKYFDNNYTHGGYECGDDGIWSNKCVISYCDLGYIFDYNENRCIKDFCSDFGKEDKEEEEDKKEEEEKEEEENQRKKENDEDEEDDEGISKTGLAIIISASIIVLIIVIIIIVILFLNKKKKDSHEQLVSNISMSVQDRGDSRIFE